MKRFDIALAEQIDAKSVGRLLVSEGWEEFREYWDDLVVYRRPEEEDSFAEILLPKERDEKYAGLIANAVQSFSEFTGKTLDEVLFGWKNPGVDRVRYRIVSEKTQFGAIPLRRAKDLIDGILATLRVAVKDASTPAPYHKRLRSAEIDELMETAEFGQTERGSFVVNVYVPTGKAKEETEFEETSRNVFRTALEGFMKSLSAAIASVDAGDVERFLQREGNEKISGSFFEAIEQARGDDGELEISVDWSPLVPVAEDTPSRVCVKKEHAAQFRRWAQACCSEEKDKAVSSEGNRAKETGGQFLGPGIKLLVLDRVFLGKIRSLCKLGQDRSGHPYGYVTFQIFEVEGETSTFLKADDYQEAVRSYRSRGYVIFSGDEYWGAGGKKKVKGIRGVKMIKYRPKRNANELAFRNRDNR